MTHAELLRAIRERKAMTPFGEGIGTADRYVKTILDCVGSDVCYRYAATKANSFDDLMQKASQMLVYTNPDMGLVEDGIEYNKAAGSTLQKYDGIELPKNTLMVFRHVLTTPRKDRDGDVLRTQGAVLDPKMLLLWQHVHTLPIGKMLAKLEHTTKQLVLLSCIVDINDLAHDAAVMIDSKMGRFSHGFRALEFNEMKAADGRSPGGFDVKSFEIMEESLVSVPANPDADTQEVILSLVEGGKLTSPMMKAVGKTIRAARPVSASVQYREKLGDYERTIETKSVGDFEAIFKTVGGTNEKGKTGHDCPCGGSSKEECTCGGAPEKADGGKAAGEDGSDDKEMKCPECGGMMKNGKCTKCGATSKSTAGPPALDDIGSIDGKCPKCGGTMKDGKCTKCGYIATAKSWGEKAGRVIADRHMKTLQETFDDLDDLITKGYGMDRAGNAIARKCKAAIKGILDDGAPKQREEEMPEPEPEKDMTVEQAMATVFAEATLAQRASILMTLKAMAEVEEANAKADEYRSIVGA